MEGIGSHWLPVLNVPKATFWLPKDWACGYVDSDYWLVSRSALFISPIRAELQPRAEPNQIELRIKPRVEILKKPYRAKPSQAEPSLESTWTEPSFEPSRAEPIRVHMFWLTISTLYSCFASTTKMHSIDLKFKQFCKVWHSKAIGI